MIETLDTKNIGLRGVKVADTRISDVDGEKGILVYRGFNVIELAQFSTFEEVSFLLLNDHLPTREELKDFQSELISEREVPEAVLKCLKMMPGATDPTHAGNFLFMLTGSLPDRETARDFDICLILHSEHSFNASTFAGREVASTHAHLYASIAAALGALSGELHGGANRQVMEMLLEIEEVNRVQSWVSERLQKGGKIMGMGHAVYHTEDPRAAILRRICERMADRFRDRRWCELSKAIETATQKEFRRLKGKEIYANVDFFSAPVYHMMGIPKDLFTPVFAISRISGWSAHIIEEKFAEAQPKPELYRPDADYIGNYCGLQGCEYIPIEERSS
ncbi:MAG: citrate (Si)-synthase [Desulfobacterales bacterium]|nr:citrate (Si)-synthase [Desulfobacterales bacterium]